MVRSPIQSLVANIRRNPDRRPEGPGTNQDVVTVLESLVNKSFSELCTQMTENIRTHVTESFETKHRELTAQNQQLVEKLEQQTQLLDKQHAWLLTNHLHPRPPTVLDSIETDEQSQQHWDAEEWRYINAPVLGHSDDSADETYVPTINFDLGDNGVENTKDGNAGDRDSDTEEKSGGSSSRRKGKGKEKMREGGKEKEKKKKKKKKNGGVQPEPTSKKRKRKWRDRAKRRRRAREQEDSSDESSVEETPAAKKWKGKVKETRKESPESSEEKETPAKRRRTARGKGTSSGSSERSDSSNSSDSSDSSESSVEETPVKRSRKARERDKGASSDRSKSRFKESPIVNPYLTKIAEEQARLARLKRMTGTSGGTGTIKGRNRHRCARGRFI
ncbi:hypothetical protein NEMBOFW57_010348 [Staphylotrichum longicolle]|uniref:Uncharacterized protein n=1 Tax=Staphylotrichum longicolle TaxID=669026 RepID=A0AAD4EMY4_9PEZI|nr:hypothetical protein NEMBOFW57_010348 [Staphylotrichum longicolle]